MAKQWLFITGTDTDVGKTVVACGFLAAANQQGLRTAAIKPVAAGCEVTEQGMTNSDALQLQAAASHKLSYQQINPVALEPAIAPHIAAAEAGVRMSASRLVGYCRGVSLLPVDMVIIEGAGGWRVPINSRETLADVAQELECAVIVVVGMRLGCLNHALLTMEAIRRDGLQIAGWVANILDTEMPRLQENIDTLKQSINEPCLGIVPRLDDLSPEQVATFLSVPGR
ncbi:dethiobiotin synthase [Porticoccaceae bacterium]|nr:dethiobiotin synthase [Porticoccaceae bacterium]MDB9948518.1 dethiobiotin synthase [Porticoccaceae bacterium]